MPGENRKYFNIVIHKVTNQMRDLLLMQFNQQAVLTLQKKIQGYSMLAAAHQRAVSPS